LPASRKPWPRREELEKAALLGEYFLALSDEDLTRAARIFAGQRFSLERCRTRTSAAAFSPAR